jgi:hypothetical protein
MLGQLFRHGVGAVPRINGDVRVDEERQPSAPIAFGRIDWLAPLDFRRFGQIAQDRHGLLQAAA